MPVLGSPSIATSGTTRPGVPQRVARSLPTTPCWEGGSANSRLVPPPPPNWNTGVPHALPASGARNAPQPVSPRYPSDCVTPSDVPPTAVTHGLDAGQSTDATPRFATSSPESPEEK